MKALLALLLLAVCAIPARAQNQFEMNRQAEAEFRKADAELNRIYAKVLAKLDDDAKTKLKAAQRAWVAFRDAEADFQMEHDAPGGGTMGPMVHAGVRSQLTATRIAQLKEVLNAP